MTTRRRVVEDPSQVDAVTVEIDPRYTARHQVDATTPAPAPVSKDDSAGEPAEDPVLRWVEGAGAYWGRAIKAAVQTVFPHGWFTSLRNYRSQKEEPTR